MVNMDVHTRVDSREKLGRLIRAERKQRKINQEALATSAGVAVGSLRHLERGDAPVTSDTLIRVTRALALDVYLVPRPRTLGFDLLQ